MLWTLVKCFQMTPLLVVVRQLLILEFRRSFYKAPERDEYPFAFFKKSWDIIGMTVCDVIQEFLRFGNFCGNCIILISHSHQNLAIIQQLLTSRRLRVATTFTLLSQKSILSRVPSPTLLIQPNLLYFVGQNIKDNIFLAQEVIRQYSRKRIFPHCMFEIDLHKANDSFSRTLSREVLHDLRFLTFIVLWIMGCVNTQCPQWLPSNIVKGIVVYWLQIFTLPTCVHQRVSRLCWVFFWGSKRPLVQWDP